MVRGSRLRLVQFWTTKSPKWGVKFGQPTVVIGIPAKRCNTLHWKCICKSWLDFRLASGSDSHALSIVFTTWCIPIFRWNSNRMMTDSATVCIEPLYNLLAGMRPHHGESSWSYDTSLGGTATDASATMTSHRPLSSAMLKGLLPLNQSINQSKSSSPPVLGA